jgi:hypothetical protein
VKVDDAMAIQGEAIFKATIAVQYNDFNGVLTEEAWQEYGRTLMQDNAMIQEDNSNG